jgi:hypothetical protein
LLAAILLGDDSWLEGFRFAVIQDEGSQIPSGPRIHASTIFFNATAALGKFPPALLLGTSELPNSQVNEALANYQSFGILENLSH